VVFRADAMDASLSSSKSRRKRGAAKVRPSRLGKGVCSGCLTTALFSCSVQRPRRKMALQVKMLHTGKTMDVRAGGSDSVLSIKRSVLKEHGVPPTLQRLMYGGHEMVDESTLREEGVTSRTTLHLGLVDRACPFRDCSCGFGAGFALVSCECGVACSWLTNWPFLVPRRAFLVGCHCGCQRQGLD